MKFFRPLLRHPGAAPSFCAWLALTPGAPAQEHPAPAQAEAQQGAEAFERGDFAAAERHFSRPLDADSSLAEVRANLGLAYYADHKYAEAVEAFRQALKQDPSLST